MAQLFPILFALILTTGLPADPLTVRVGWDEFEPYQYTIGGKQTGIDSDLVQTVLEKAGYGVDFVRMPWARQLVSLRTGDLDLSVDATVDQERGMYADFTRFYRKEIVGLLTLKTNSRKVDSLADLVKAGIHIGIMKDSVYGGDFGTLLNRSDFQEILEPVANSELNLLKLANGRINYIIDDAYGTQYQAKKRDLPPLKVALIVDKNDVSFMVSKKLTANHPDLIDRLNKAILTLQRDGTFEMIYKKYGVTF